MLLRQEQWAQQALRVLGFAYQEISAQDAAHLSEEELEKDLTLLGICGMIDPPREGVAESVRICRQAGITPIMITGDHPLTALAIGRQIGLSSHDHVITGLQIDTMDDNQLFNWTMQSRVFARVTPNTRIAS